MAEYKTEQSGATATTVEIPLSSLKQGSTLRLPIFDSTGVLLMAPGATLNAPLLERLAQRGVSSIRVHRSEVSHLTGKEKEAPETQPVEVGPVSFLSQVQKPGNKTYTSTAVKAAQSQRTQAMKQVNELFHAIGRVESEDLNKFQGLTATAIGQMATDIDLFCSHGLIPPGFGEYPANHGVQFGMMALSIGAQMKMTQDDLKTLGVGCLVHDMGMLKLNQKVLLRAGPLSIEARLEISKHPTITFDMLRDVEWLAGASRIIAYEVHERMDGSGYPRQRQGNQIHPLSRIAAISDSYIAMTTDRPHRKKMLPYHAMAQILKDTNDKKYDGDTVRAMLRALSIFPVGSFIELSDGRVGRVIRANGDEFTRPIVEAWDPTVPEPLEVVNLVEERNINISRAVLEVPPPPKTPEELAEEAERRYEEELLAKAAAEDAANNPNLNSLAALANA